MFNKKIILLTIILIAILSISVVSAEDSMDPLESVDDSAVDEVVEDPVASVDDAALLDESIENVEIIEDNSDMVSDEKGENVEMETADSDDIDSDDVEEELVSYKQPKNSLKYVYGYVTSATAQYGSDETVSLGWNGYIDGNFKVYKGSSVVFNYALSGLNQDYTYRVSGLKVGTYYAKLISDYYGVLDSAKIVIKKATTKISVKSFSARAGSKVYCYAYVTLKSNGRNLNGKYVKFIIAGKTYKAKLKSGVARLYFKVPKKIKTYKCKAYFPGSKNTKKSSTKFKLKVKKPIKYKVMSAKTRWDKYVTKRWGKYKVQTYKFKNTMRTMSTLCVFLYKNGRMVDGSNYYSKIHYKYNGRWYWTKWRSSYGEAVYHKTAGIDPSVKIGKVKVKFRVS